MIQPSDMLQQNQYMKHNTTIRHATVKSKTSSMLQQKKNTRENLTYVHDHDEQN